MEIKDMCLEDVVKRRNAIATEMNAEGADLDALDKELDALLERENAIKEMAEKRKKMEQRVMTEGIIVKKPEEETRKEYGADSKEYRSAFLKSLMGKESEWTPEERAAYTHTTSNTSAVLPTEMIDQIWNLIGKRHAILDDITVYRTGTIIEVVKHTAIAQGDAATVNEGAANDDEQNTFVKVTLSGKDFSKHIDITYALEKMSLDSFQSYLVNEIGDRLANALCDDVYAQIGTDMTSANKVDTAVSGKIAWADLTGTFALLENADAVTVYCKRATLYGYLAAMVDSTGRPIFQPSAQAGVEGYLLGAPVKIEESVATKKILIGDPKKVIMNMVQDIMIEDDRDIKKHVITYAGYCRAESALIAPSAFALLTVKN